MSRFINMLKSNLYKYMKLSIGKVHIIVPIVAIAVFSLYFQAYRMTVDNKMITYSKLMCYGYIFMISIIVTVSYELNQRAGNCQDILAASCGKTKAHIANLLSMSLMSFAALAVSFIGFYFINVYNKESVITIKIVMILLFIVFAVNIIMYILQYMICYTFGKGASIGIGVLATLLAVLVDVTWENGWKFLPSAYAPKYMDLYLDTKVFKISDSNLYDSVIDNYTKSTPIVLVISLICVVGFVIWGKLWEGKDFEME